MVHIHLNPLDTIFFRDSRPFAAGDDVYAESGIPSPLAIYGAIGSYCLDATGKSLADFKANGDAKLGSFDDALANSDGLRIKGPFLCKDGVLYFAPPANMWRLKDAPKPQLLLPTQSSSQDERTDSSLSLQTLSAGSDSYLEPYEGYISIKYLSNYLRGAIPTRLETVNESAFFHTESRMGHQIESGKGTVSDGMLYSSRHLRFDDRMRSERRSQTSLLVIAEQLDAGDFTLPSYCMGGERRSLKVTATEPLNQLFPPITDDVIEKIQRDKKFFLYLVTPALFRDGWKPHPFDGATMVGAALSKHRFISGWQSLVSKPRPLLKMVPAGAVYFYTVDASMGDADLRKLITTYHFNKSISDHYPNAGFGTTLLGTW